MMNKSTYTRSALLAAVLGLAVAACDSGSNTQSTNIAATESNRVDQEDTAQPTVYTENDRATAEATESTEGALRTGRDLSTAGRDPATTTPGAETTAPQANATTQASGGTVGELQESVYFDGFSTSLSDEATSKLEGLVQRMDKSTPVILTVRVEESQNAEPSDAQAAGDLLAEQRAAAIRDYLQKQGLEVANWAVEGVGEESAVTEEAPAITTDAQTVVISINDRSTSGAVSGMSAE